jgi:hypothetical protein
MEPNIELTTTSSPNFCDEYGRAYLVKCPECKAENYALAVANGICMWCGYDLNIHKIIKNTNP